MDIEEGISRIFIVSVSVFRRPISLWSFCFDSASAVLTAGRLSFRLDRPLAASSVESVPVDVVMYLFALVELTCWFGELTVYLASRELLPLKQYVQAMFLVHSLGPYYRSHRMGRSFEVDQHG